MICRKCATEPATYHISETDVEGVRRHLHLCAECARLAGFTGTTSPSVRDFLERIKAPADDPGYTVRPAAPVLCQVCSKAHASIHMFEATQGYEREWHRCAECGRVGAAHLEAAFAEFPQSQAEGAPPRAVCPGCGQVRFDFRQVGVQVRGSIQHAILPIRILVRGCAWGSL